MPNSTKHNQTENPKISDRLERRAKALRSNLKRRKSQTRERTEDVVTNAEIKQSS